MKMKWSEYKPFPDPRKLEYLHAPFGAGIYELLNTKTKELIKVGEGANVAERMSSLLPKPYGASGRNNQPLRDYILQNLKSIAYRTLPCIDKGEAMSIEKQLRKTQIYMFPR